eukprot:COSAG02_NODE_1541_length_12013_cov_16.409182_5_plen_82_part_00
MKLPLYLQTPEQHADKGLRFVVPKRANDRTITVSGTDLFASPAKFSIHHSIRHSIIVADSDCPRIGGGARDSLDARSPEVL